MRPRSATPRCRRPISCSRRARSGSTAGRCRASTTPRSTRSFSPTGSWKSNFLCNLGKGDAAKLPPVNPRFGFEEVCKITLTLILRRPRSGPRRMDASAVALRGSLRSHLRVTAHDFPYTGTMAPRVTAFSGEARNRIVAATSSTFGQAAKSAFGIALRFAGVSMIEGATALTRMPSLATSSASACVSAASPALRRRIGGHARAGARLERGARRDIDDAPAAAGLAERAHRRAAAQIGRDEIALDLPHQQRLVAFLDRREGKAARDMDRGPEFRDAGVERVHRRLVGEIAERDERDLLVLAMRKTLRLVLAAIGHMAGRAGVDQRADHRGAERAGAAGHHHMTIAIVHSPRPLWPAPAAPDARSSSRSRSCARVGRARVSSMP